MKFGICNLSIVPCRAEPADASEMVTQMLFGDHCKIIEERAKWSKVRLAYDKYEGWVDKKQVLEITKADYDQLEKNKHYACSLEMVGVLENGSDQSVQPIVLGSSLPNFEEGQVNFADQTFRFEGNSIHSSEKSEKEKLVEHAYMYLNTPYLWGGRSPFGIDCSGFCQIVYKLVGKKMPRDASQQAEIGQTLSFIEEAEEGDLAFFDNDEGEIIHVGMLLKDNYIIHASGKVRIDRIDHQGIYNIETKRYTHKLRLIKRVI